MKARIKFSKQGNLRFVGHLDIMRYFQKAIRRAGLPVKYSEGFSPHQIMSFAAPLGMGLEGTAEYFDIRLEDGAEETFRSGEYAERLDREMAEGMKILEFLKIPDDAKNCMAVVHAADYTVRFLPEGMDRYDAMEAEAEGRDIYGADQETLSLAAEELLKKEEIIIRKKGKKGNEREVDIRPMIFSLSVKDGGLFMRVAQGSEANLKPELLLDALLETEHGKALCGRKRLTVRTELYDAEMRTLGSYGEYIG